jgi:hypothetical protein
MGHALAGQEAPARALMWPKAVTMSLAQGQLAWIFSCRLRAPRVMRAAACRILYRRAAQHEGCGQAGGADIKYAVYPGAPVIHSVIFNVI